MDAFTHTLLAVGSLVAFFFAGRFLGQNSTVDRLAEDMVEHTINQLERDGLIRVETDKDGEKEIVPISEIISDTLRNAKV
tara:strand:+ start:4235 stop:4474 length:240 start_codon:yes stop_codon:yes gene_type:complete